MNIIESKGLTKSYGRSHAVYDLTFSIRENTITGLIGRNGAGKTTLLRLMAGYLHQTKGEIHVFGEEPFNSLNVSANFILVDEHMHMPTSLNLGQILQAAGSFYAQWDMNLAQRLLQYFSLPADQNHHQLSKGMKSTFNTILGLASRCPLTAFDEPTSGMDSSVRKDFYRALLKDYLAHPRTILLSSHLLNEIEDLLEDVLLLKEGQLCLHQSVSELKEYALALHGPAQVVERFAESGKVLHRSHIGQDSAIFVVRNDFDESDLHELKAAGVNTSSVPTDDICVYLTSTSKGGIDDVFQRNEHA